MYSDGKKPSEMFLSYNNRENDEGWREVIDLERSFKRDTQLKYKQMLDDQIRMS